MQRIELNQNVNGRMVVSSMWGTMKGHGNLGLVSHKIATRQHKQVHSAFLASFSSLISGTRK